MLIVPHFKCLHSINSFKLVINLYGSIILQVSRARLVNDLCRDYQFDHFISCKYQKFYFRCIYVGILFVFVLFFVYLFVVFYCLCHYGFLVCLLVDYRDTFTKSSPLGLFKVSGEKRLAAQYMCN